jgi:hypothetical protein
MLGGRPASVRGPSVERTLEVDYRIPSAYLGRQVEFITCTVGDTYEFRLSQLISGFV